MKAIRILSIILLSVSFSYSQKFEIKQGGHSYTMEIPDYMSRTFDLNDVATMQYKNILKETYAIVIEDDKEELQSLGMTFTSPSDFLEYFVQDYYAQAEKREVTEAIEFENNGYAFSQVELIAETADISLFMVITAVESETHYYKILCWTLLEYKDKYEEDFKRMAKSLKD